MIKKILLRNLKKTAALFIIIFSLTLLLQSPRSPFKMETDFAGDYFFNPAGREPAAQDPALKFSQVSEVELFRQVEREAARRFDSIRPMLEQPITQTQWMKLVRVVTEQLSQVVAFRKTVIELSKKAGATLVVSEILTTFVTPPILLALGQPALAAFFATVPTSPFISAGKVLMINFWDRYKLSRDLGISLSELDVFRSELLGLERTDHIVSLTYEVVDAELPRVLDIRIVNAIKGKSSRDAFQLRELVSIVAGSGADGELYLSRIAAHRGKTPLYAAELIAFIRERPALMKKLISFMKERETLPPELARLKKLNLHMAELSTELNALNEELKLAYKEVRRNLLSTETRQLNQYFKECSRLATYAFEAVQMAEYQVLAVYKANPQNTDALLGAQYVLEQTMLYFESRVNINRATLSYIREEIPYNVARLPKLFYAEERFRPRTKISECMALSLPFLGI